MNFIFNNDHFTQKTVETVKNTHATIIQIKKNIQM